MERETAMNACYSAECVATVAARKQRKSSCRCWGPHERPDRNASERSPAL